MLRILSWNVNGIRAIEKKGFTTWVATDSPDIVCLQETKARPDQLSAELIELKDSEGRLYKVYWAWAKRPGYSGVAIYSRQEPLDVSLLNIADFDDEGRVLVAEYPAFSLINAYFPNSQEAGARLDYKLAFCAAILETCQARTSKGRDILLCGDYNIAHTNIDLANPKANEGNPGYLPEERAWMDSFTSQGFTDTFRCRHPGEPEHYTWWSYRLRARERNIGWRIDYHCVNDRFDALVERSIIRPEITGSDHCPVEVVLKL